MVRTFVIAALVVALTMGAGLLWFAHWRSAPIAFSAETTYDLAPGTATQRVIDQLERQLQPSSSCFSLCFRLLIEMERAGARLQSGEYLVQEGITPDELLAQLTAGDVITYMVRIPEGITVRELLLKLRAETNLMPLEEHIDDRNLATALGLQSSFAEGYFLPDTYQFKKGDLAADVLRRAHRAMVEEINLVWASRGEVEVDSPEELLILASIIEKETGDPADRGLISQVFHRRLALDMRLQTDPTVIFALGATFDGNIRRADLRIDSPYNTYRVKGLPPTPIALPSKAALRAAAHPDDGEYLYFVARGDGTSQFSKTLDEHNQAVRRYQLQAK